MEPSRLSKYISKAPHKPGVYVWRDTSKKPLYIGKATDLRNRLANYRKAADSRIQMMVQTAATLEWQELDTDIEALITESQLIKRLRPKFNITMRDDKQYFFIALTDEDFPQFIVTHQAANSKIKRPIKELIGPFTEGAPLKGTLRVLRGMFPYCTCKTKHHLPCLNAHIGRCPGYCCLKSPIAKAQKTEYAANVRTIRDVLTGKRASAIRTLKKEMKAAGENGRLENALSLQRKIEQLERVFQNARINSANLRLSARHHGALEQLVSEFGLTAAPQRIEGYDIANIQGEHANGAMVVFTDGRADNPEYRLFNIQSANGGDTAMLQETLDRRLRHPEWHLPDLILVDGGRGQLNAAVHVLAQAGQAIPVLALTKDDRHRGDHVISSLDKRVRRLAALPRSLADLILHVDAEAHRFAIKHYRRRHGRSLLNG